MSRKNTALFIIDMQNDFVLEGANSCVSGAKDSIPSIEKVLNLFRDKELPIFHIVREYRDNGSDIEIFRYESFMNGKKSLVPNTKGCDIVDALTPLPNEYKIIKQRFSGFMNTELDLILRRLEIKNVVITGTQYPNCVRATAFDAMALDYKVTIVTDATSAQSKEVALANIFDMKNVGINCINSNELKI